MAFPSLHDSAFAQSGDSCGSKNDRDRHKSVTVTAVIYINPVVGSCSSETPHPSLQDSSSSATVPWTADKSRCLRFYNLTSYAKILSIWKTVTFSLFWGKDIANHIWNRSDSLGVRGTKFIAEIHGNNICNSLGLTVSNFVNFQFSHCVLSTMFYFAIAAMKYSKQVRPDCWLLIIEHTNVWIFYEKVNFFSQKNFPRYCYTQSRHFLAFYVVIDIYQSVRWGQVWGHTPEQRVAASTLRRYSLGLRLAIAQTDARPVMSISFR